jgi:glycosyltransferase involved in cell wall biosynthesis
MIELFSQADIFALPTRADLSPAAICEAMAMKLPVVTTNVGGLNELVVDGETGFIAASEDENEYDEKLYRLVKDPSLRYNFGENARRVVEEKYDIKKNADKVLNIMRAAAEKRITQN